MVDEDTRGWCARMVGIVDEDTRGWWTWILEDGGRGYSRMVDVDTRGWWTWIREDGEDKQRDEDGGDNRTSTVCRYARRMVARDEDGGDTILLAQGDENGDENGDKNGDENGDQEWWETTGRGW